MGWAIPQNFDGEKFAKRYSLNGRLGDFSVVDGQLFLRAGITLPDDPPIFETVDPIVPAPAGIWVHEMKALTKKRGEELIDGDGTTSFYIVVDSETKLTDPWLADIAIDVGSTVYIIDKAKTLVWDGSKWK